MNLAAALADVVRAAVAPLVHQVAELTAAVEALRASQTPKLVSPAEAATALGLSIATVRRRIADQTLPSRHIGRRVLVDLATMATTSEGRP